MFHAHAAARLHPILLFSDRFSNQLSNLAALAAVAPNVLLHDMSLYFGPANASARGLPQPRSRAQLQQVGRVRARSFFFPQAVTL